MYLVDTNVVSEIRKEERANKGVRDFFRQAVKEEAGLYMSVVTAGELRRGVELIRHRGDHPQAAALETWLTSLLEEFAHKRRFRSMTTPDNSGDVCASHIRNMHSTS